jgi:ATP-dependent DNA helicase RecQ
MGVVELIINACAEISKVNYFGATMTVNVLRGSKNQQVINYKLNELDCYGVLKSIKTRHVFDIVEFLIEENYLYRTQGLYPTVRVNSEKSIEDIHNIDLSIVEEIIALNNTNAKPKIQTVDDGMTIVVEGWEVYIDEDGTLITDIKLLKRLQSLRKKIGDEKDIPYYCVAWDRVLVQLATKKPTREEFLSIKGIRDRWFDNNGQAFMKEIREYVESK